MFMLELNKYVLPADAIVRIPGDDRSLMIWCGHIHNELVVMLKFLGAVGYTNCDNATEVEANTVQLLTTAKIIAGKLWEGWLLIEAGMLKNKATREYVDQLNPEAVAALEELKKYFGSNNRLKQIRNSYAFHYDFNGLKELPEGWENVPDELSFSVGAFPFHTLFFVSEVVVNKSMFLAFGANDAKEGARKFWDEISSVTTSMIRLCGGIFSSVIERHVGKPGEIDAAIVGIPNPPRESEVVAPFYILPSK